MPTGPMPSVKEEPPKTLVKPGGLLIKPRELIRKHSDLFDEDPVLKSQVQGIIRMESTSVEDCCKAFEGRPVKEIIAHHVAAHGPHQAAQSEPNVEKCMSYIKPSERELVRKHSDLFDEDPELKVFLFFLKQ